MKKITSLITNSTGSIVEETTYEPFGKVFSGGDDRYLYTGKELDTGTGLEYYGARYYDPAKVSQFISPDPVISDVYDPQNLNRYSYVLNNPYKYTDESGNVPAAVVPILAAGTISGLISFSLTYMETGDLGKSLTAGGIGFAAGAASAYVATAAGITAIAGGGLRYVGVQGAKNLLTTGGKLASIGTARSAAEQYVVDENIDIGQATTEGLVESTASVIIPEIRIAGRSLPGIVPRQAGQFFPSSSQITSPVIRESISQVSQTAYTQALNQVVTSIIGYSAPSSYTYASSSSADYSTSNDLGSSSPSSHSSSNQDIFEKNKALCQCQKYM